MTAEQIVKMDASSFKTADQLEKEQEMREAQMAENQTDYFRVQDAKENQGKKKEGFFECEKCESKNTSFY
jgi:hypothetical protein